MERQMKKFTFYFSRRDCLFTVACIGFLLTTIGAIGSTGRRRAKEAVCRSNLRQWGVIFQEFTNDNDGYFIDSENPYYSPGWYRGKWALLLRRQYVARANILLCPEAIEPLYTYGNYGGPFNTYSLGNTTAPLFIRATSYGANAWIYMPTPAEIETGEIQGRPVEWNWKTPHVKNAGRIPVFADTMWRGGGPISGDPYEQVNGMNRERSSPPEVDGEWDSAKADMKHFCINRHNGGVNHLFMDWSVRKVGLKELWKLKWHREFNTNGPWTQAGGITARDWPEWLRDFKDF